MIEQAVHERESRVLPGELLECREWALRCLCAIIADTSADFYVRRMAVWWGGQFRDRAFNAFLKHRFLGGKVNSCFEPSTESSVGGPEWAEEGLRIEAADVLSADWKP